jgi:hypothetical protein
MLAIAGGIERTDDSLHGAVLQRVSIPAGQGYDIEGLITSDFAIVFHFHFMNQPVGGAVFYNTQSSIVGQFVQDATIKYAYKVVDETDIPEIMRAIFSSYRSSTWSFGFDSGLYCVEFSGLITCHKGNIPPKTNR